MRIAIATVQVPFARGGAEILVEMLKQELIKRGYKADIVSIPFKWYPWEKLIDSANISRMIDLSEAEGEKIDRVIAVKFPAYYVKHDNKVVWLMHQHRQAYDLWGSEFGDLDRLENGRKIKNFIQECDNQYLAEAKAVYTIAKTTSMRLEKYNGIPSETLYHPPLNYEKLHCESYGDYIFYASRINTIKRQRLLVEAARYFRTDAKVVIAGGGVKQEIDYINGLIEQYNLGDRVKMAGFISEEEKLRCYANCLAVYFGAYNEDYGYITLEAFFSEKPVIVHKDSGGPLEFVEDERNGFVIDDDPLQIARKVDYLYEHRDRAREMGRYGRQSLIEKHMDWDYVIDRLLEN